MRDSSAGTAEQLNPVLGEATGAQKLKLSQLLAPFIALIAFAGMIMVFMQAAPLVALMLLFVSVLFFFPITFYRTTAGQMLPHAGIITFGIWVCWYGVYVAVLRVYGFRIAVLVGAILALFVVALQYFLFSNLGFTYNDQAFAL